MQVVNGKYDFNAQLVVTAAVRYALGRQTYIVSAIVEWVLDNWSCLTPKTIHCMIGDIERQRSEGSLGDECDANQWERILKKAGEA